MQVSADGTCKFINCGSGETRADKTAFYYCTVVDEKGETFRLFCDVMTYGRLSTLSFGDELTPVFDLYSGRNGIACRLRDFINPSHV